tara:strand:+ start:23770 stop:23979 length:210 start_codon:yes stop_codon:yes gene_type:complete
MDFKYINTGTKPNSNDADSIKLAFEKVNDNFKLLIDINLHDIVWNGLEDTKPCFDNVNENFKIIKEWKK